MLHMDEIAAKATELGNSIDNVNKEIKRVASVKCRLKKMPGKADYVTQMAAVLEEEEILKAVRDLLKGPAKNVNTLTEEEIKVMDYTAVIKAIRAIQSKKSHTRYADDCLKDEEGLYIPGSGESYKEACRIEDLLKARRDELQPIKGPVVSLTDDEIIALRSMIVCTIEQYETSDGEIDYADFGVESVGLLKALMAKLPEVTE